MSADYYAASRKIDPTQAQGQRIKPDGSPDDNNRVEIGPTALAFDEWRNAGIEVPNLDSMRAFRLQRLVAEINRRDYAGVLMFDPLNIRYASDTTNMQLWAMHNMFRACLVMADGYMIIWDYKGNDLLTHFNPLVRETRGGASFFYFSSGDSAEQCAARFADELADVLREHCGDNRKLAIDKIMISGLRALEERGISVEDGEEIMEKTRSVKGSDEI